MVWKIKGEKLVSVPEFAKHIKVTRTTVYTWIIQEHMPAYKSQDEDRYLINLEEAKNWVIKNKIKYKFLL